MREIVLVNSTPFGDVPALRVSEITYLPLLKALRHALLESPALLGSSRESRADSSKDSLLAAAIDRSIDVIIATSKHAAYALERAIAAHSELAALREKSAFAIGTGTAEALERAGVKVEFVSPSGHGASFAREIIAKLQERREWARRGKRCRKERGEGLESRRALYLRAEHIISGLDSALTDAGIALIQIIAYTNTPLRLPKSAKPARGSIVIFTAPSNYRAFVENFGWDSSYIAIAIGESTRAAFAPEIVAHVSPEQSIAACVELANFLRDNARG